MDIDNLLSPIHITTSDVVMWILAEGVRCVVCRPGVVEYVHAINESYTIAIAHEDISFLNTSIEYMVELHVLSIPQITMSDVVN